MRTVKWISCSMCCAHNLIYNKEMIIWVVEVYTNLHAQVNGGHCSSHSLYDSWMRIALFAVFAFILHCPIVTKVRDQCWTNWSCFYIFFLLLSNASCCKIMIMNFMPMNSLTFQLIQIILTYKTNNALTL